MLAEAGLLAHHHTGLMAATKAALHKTSVLFGSFASKDLLGICEDEDDHILVSFRSYVKRFNVSTEWKLRRSAGRGCCAGTRLLFFT